MAVNKKVVGEAIRGRFENVQIESVHWTELEKTINGYCITGESYNTWCAVIIDSAIKVDIPALRAHQKRIVDNEKATSMTLTLLGRMKCEVPVSAHITDICNRSNVYYLKLLDFCNSAIQLAETRASSMSKADCGVDPTL